MGCVYTIHFGINSQAVEQFAENTGFLIGNPVPHAALFFFFQKGKYYIVGISMKFAIGKKYLSHAYSVYIFKDR